MGDPRRTRRLVKIVADQAAHPSGSYAQAAGDNRHDLKGYYRFLNSEREDLNPASLLHTHRTPTIRRMKRESTALIVKDTTELNFSTRLACEGLGPIGTNQTGTQSRGLDLHSGLAVGGRKAELLVRAQDDRCLEGTDRKLFAELAAAPLAKRVRLPVPRQREHRAKSATPGRAALPARMAKVEVRFQEVSLSAPQTPQTRQKPPLKPWAVSVREKYPPKGATAAHWLLLTSIAIAGLGGYLNRRCDGPPGFESLWTGYARFHDMVLITRLRRAAEAQRR